MIAYLECSTGVSGDKLLGALVHAGFDPSVLRCILDDAGLEGVTLDVTRGPSGDRGLQGVCVSVEEAGAPRRTLAEIRGVLERASLPDPVRFGAISALESLGRAEAAVHDVPVEDVHFHEVGAADTIVDILGVALALHCLDINELVASPVAVGSGFVRTEHGVLPVPAPATARLLEGVPVEPGPASGELTTPTGAALITTFATSFGPMPAMTLRRVGCGYGTRRLDVPNVCRLLLGEPVRDREGTEDVAVLETNLDHLTGEEIAVAATRLREAGALDVWLAPIVMKKGRLATVLSALVPAADAPDLAGRVMAETGTLGVRVVPGWRRIVVRDIAEIETSLGNVRFKVAYLPDGERVLRVENDDAARLSALHHVPVDSISRMLESEAAVATGIQPMRQRLSSHDTNPSD